MSFIVDIINNNQNRFVFQILGSIMLMAFGIYCYRSDPTKKIHISGSKKGSLIHNCVTAFLVTFSNPLIIFLFMAAFAQFAFVMPKHPLHMCVGYLSIICGACCGGLVLHGLLTKSAISSTTAASL